MSFKTLLVHVEATPESDLRLRAAVGLASELGATLIGLGGCEPIYLASPWASAYSDGEFMQMALDQDGADLKEAAARFHAQAHVLGAEAMWTSYGDYPDHALEVCAAGADLMVASAHRGPKASTAAAIDLVMRAGIPVLTIPADLPAIATKTIVIAWKNTPEARSAVSSALPLLKAAKQVTVLRVCRPAEDRASNGLDDVVGRLKRHGVNVAADMVEHHKGEFADAVTGFAERGLFDLIVCGAYGHSRMREWALGGVTQGLLDRSPLPVLFSH